MLNSDKISLFFIAHSLHAIVQIETTNIRITKSQVKTGPDWLVIGVPVKCNEKRS